MTLWHLLLALNISFALGCGLGAAHLEKGGVPGYVIATCVSLLIGVGGSWLTHEIGRRVYVGTREYPEAKQDRAFRLLYVAFCCYIPLAGLLNGELIVLLLRPAWLRG